LTVKAKYIAQARSELESKQLALDEKKTKLTAAEQQLAELTGTVKIHFKLT
jgi:hypothetical protein